MSNNQPITCPVRFETLGATTGSGTTVTAGALGSKGAVTTIGTTSFRYDAIMLCVEAGALIRGRLDILVNNGGSDQVVIADFPINLVSTYSGPNATIPVSIPAGAIVKARWMASTASASLTVLVVGMQGDGKLMRGFRALLSGTDWSTTSPNVDPNVTVALTGTTTTAWTQVTASTPAHFSGLYGTLSSLGVNTNGTGSVLVTVGYGAAGSERALFQFTVRCLNSYPEMNSFFGPIPCSIAAGTRLAFQMQANGTTPTTTMGLALSGLAA